MYINNELLKKDPASHELHWLFILSMAFVFLELADFMSFFYTLEAFGFFQFPVSFLTTN